jgi:hypothetical protein
VRSCPPARQRAIHLGVIAVSLAVLLWLVAVWGSPLLPDGRWRPEAVDAPIARLLGLLAMSVGVPFFVLAATAPLLQTWFRFTHPRQSPYRLYAVSNLGSLLGLISYPLALEVLASLRLQSYLWGAGYLVFATGIGVCALLLGNHSGPASSPPEPEAAERPEPLRYLLWFGLAACASTLLLAITNHLCQEIATLPLLWVLPLSLYLLSFILCFDSSRWYSRRFYFPALIVSLALITLQLHSGPGSHLLVQIALSTLALFTSCMVCHGELVRLKPPDRHLTSFYLSITAGGVAGALFVTLLAPLVFTGYWELGVGLWACTALTVVVLVRDPESVLHRGSALSAVAILAAAALVLVFVVAERLPTEAVYRALEALGNWAYVLPAAGVLLALLLPQALARVRRLRDRFGNHVRTRMQSEPRWASWPLTGLLPRSPRLAAVLGALVFFGVSQILVAQAHLHGVVSASRNFYGTLAVVDEHPDDPERHQHKLVHGRIVHGLQYQTGERRRLPGAYYGPNSGIGLAIAHHPRRRTGQAMRIGVIGLGAGMLAAYGRHGDRLRFYEINPDVIRLAAGPQALFTYIADSPATVDVVAGDARLVLERKLATGTRQGFHVLALDAFNSDAIPVHLLTSEAFAVYLQHLDAENGLLALHITNQHLDLHPIVGRLARLHGLAMWMVVDDSDSAWHNTWVLLSRNPAAIDPALDKVVPVGADYTRAPLWTDDYSNLLQILRFPRVRRESDGTPAACSTAECQSVLDVIEQADSH